MDSLTQATLGAAIGEAVLGKKIGSKGAILGAIAGTIPDLDVILYLFYDKLDMLSIHRGYSHSVAFTFIVAFGLTLLLKRLKWVKDISFLRVFVFSWLALFTHILLDAFTAYGTQIFLPFSDVRFGLDSINVVDPVYTIPLLIGLLSSFYFRHKGKNHRYFNYVGMVISSLYLLTTLGIKNHVNERFKSDLINQDLKHIELLTMPVGMASLNWYGVARDEKNIYMKKYHILRSDSFDFETFPINEHLLDQIGPEFESRMKWFAKGFYTVAQHGDTIRIYNLQVDMRGIVGKDGIHAPTKGYFEFTPIGVGKYKFSSGAHD